MPRIQHGVLVSQGHSRLEIESSHIPKNRPHLWPTGDMSICHKTNNSVPSLLQLVARFLCSVNRCISPYLDRSEGLCQPPLESHMQSPCTSSETEGSNSSCGSIMERQPWFPVILRMLIDYRRQMPAGIELTHSMDPTLTMSQLAVWHISGRDTETSKFQRMQQHSYLAHGEPNI